MEEQVHSFWLSLSRAVCGMARVVSSCCLTIGVLALPYMTDGYTQVVDYFRLSSPLVALMWDGRYIPHRAGQNEFEMKMFVAL